MAVEAPDRMEISDLYYISTSQQVLEQAGLYIKQQEPHLQASLLENDTFLNIVGSALKNIDNKDIRQQLAITTADAFESSENRLEAYDMFAKLFGLRVSIK